MDAEIQILIIDHDSVHLTIFKEKLSSISYKNVFLCTTFEEAKRILEIHTIDLIFIDHSIDSWKIAVDFFKDYIFSRGIPIIVMSVFYNEKIFKEVLSILPVDFISKNCTEFDLKKSIELSLIKRDEIKNKPKLNAFFFVKEDKNIFKINIDSIEMIEVYGKNLNIYTEERKYVVRTSLNEFSKRLPRHFIKVHQSYIINVEYIDTVQLEDQVIKLRHYDAQFSKNYRKLLLNNYYV